MTERDTAHREIVPAYGSGAAEHRSAQTIDEWKKQSEEGKVCGILGCQGEPMVRCEHCGNWYCDDHKLVLKTPAHPQ